MNKEMMVTEVMYLGAMVNANIEFCVFVRYSGHVDVLNVDISESKENYGSKVFDEDARLSHTGGNKSLQEIKEEFINILDDHGISYESPFKSTEGVEEAAPAKPSGLEERVVNLEKEMTELKVMLSSHLKERGSTCVSKELPRGRWDCREDGERLEDRLQEAL